MNKIKWAFLLIFIILMGCATTRIDYGGNLGEYLTLVKLARRTEQKVIIDYECYSACVLWLSVGPDLRVSKKALFGVHEARKTSFRINGILTPPISYEFAKRSEDMTKFYRSRIPECAVRLFDSEHAFDSGEITTFTGEEVLKACPEIKEYIAK